MYKLLAEDSVYYYEDIFNENIFGNIYHYIKENTMTLIRVDLISITEEELTEYTYLKSFKCYNKSTEKQ